MEVHGSGTCNPHIGPLSTMNLHVGIATLVSASLCLQAGATARVLGAKASWCFVECRKSLDCSGLETLTQA